MGHAGAAQRIAASLEAVPEPFRLDYVRWAAEIAQLSVREPNLVAWSLDDFSYDSKTFTVDYVRKMINGSRGVTPLALSPAFITATLHRSWQAGIGRLSMASSFGLHEAGKRNLSQWDTLEKELARVRERFGGKVPVFLDVYATKHSQLNDSTAEYVEEVMKIGRRCADGVLIYQHQYEATSPEKYHVIKELFDGWAKEKPRKTPART